MTPGPKDLTRHRNLGLLAAVALLAFLPFARGMLSGQTFFFRDLSRQFFPYRLFLVDGLLHGELRYWNPYVHEGEPISLPPISYPLDLLQALVPDERGISLSLALHVPLAALAFLAFARRGLGLSSAAAAGGALAYALGGFCISSLNLYIQIAAVAWAPLVVLGVLMASRGGPREWAVGAILTAVGLSTTGIEVVGQALLVGAVLAATRRGRWWAGAGATLALGAGLAAPTLLVMRTLVANSARAKGFPTSEVLGFEVHPLGFLQVMVSALYGDPSDYVDQFWGANFFKAFPYLLSLYLGATVLCAAAVGALCGRTLRGRLVLLALGAAFLCLGERAGLGIAVEALPIVRAFRYPSKAFFTAHFALAALAALGIDSLGREDGRRAWRRLAAWSATLGGVLVLLPVVPRLLPGSTLALVSDFFPPALPDSVRMRIAAFVAHDAFLGGATALGVAVAGLLTLRGRLESRRAAMVVVALAAADLVRANAGLNPTVEPAFFDLSPEMARVAADLKQEGGRVFTCDPELGSQYWLLRRERARGVETWTIATLMETLTPFYNMREKVLTAYSRDLTMLVPVDRILAAAEAGCASFPDLTKRLRAAAVGHVVSLSPLGPADLRLRSVVEPARTRPAAIYVYDLADPLPLRAVATNVRRADGAEEASSVARQPGFQGAGGVAVEGIAAETSGAVGRITSLAESPMCLELVAEADRPTAVVVRDAFAPGWSATVNGTTAPVLRADGRHRAVAIGAGTSRVVLHYRPPGLREGLALMALAAAVTLLLLFRRSLRPGPA